mgnify:CR=1 FL=1
MGVTLTNEFKSIVAIPLYAKLTDKSYIAAKELIKNYQNSKNNAIVFMGKGQLNAYFDALVEMNHYQKLMLTVSAN